MKDTYKKRIFSIPFNGDLKLMKWAINTGQVKEIYFASLSMKTLSLQCDASPHFYNEDTINELLEICRNKGVETNLLVNQLTLIQENMDTCVKYIKGLKYLSSLTIGDPLAVDFFIRSFPGLDIQASIIMNLYSVNMIENLLKRGIGTISLPPEFSRNYQILKRLSLLKRKYPKFKIKLFISYICYSDCPFMMSHFALRAFRSFRAVKNKRIEAYLYKDYCMNHPEKAELIKRPFVRPEDIDNLIDSGFADYLKIIYRFDDSTILQKKLSAYFERVFQGNLFEIIPYPYSLGNNKVFFCDNRKFPKDFFSKVFHCKKICFNCNYCDRVAQLVIKVKN